MNNNSNHKNGRPSKTGQLEIQRTLRPFFEQGISASLASEKTGINIKTICKYFDFWTQEISEAEASEFLERQKKERIRTIISLDKQIVEANQLLDGVSEEITKLFRPFGLTEYEARIYFTLQVCGQTTISQLRIKSGVPQSKIYQVMPDLAIKGLVEIIPKQPKEARANPFLRFANDFLTARKCLLDEISKKIEQHREVMKKTVGYVQVLG